MLNYKINIILFLKIIFKPLNLFINKIIKKSNFFLIWRSGKAIGDQVLMAGFAKSLHVKYKNPIIILTNYPEVISLSPWVYKTIEIKKNIFWRIIYYFLKISEGERIIEYNFPYRKYGFRSHLNAYQSGFYEILKKPPIWHAHVADRFDKEIFKDFSGGLEKSSKKDAFLIIKEIRKRYNNHKIGIINPIGKSSYTKVKMYGFDNYQKIINLTKSKILWIQVGKKEDMKLKYLHLDLRGRSLDFLVDIIYLSDLVLSDEGLLNHIAGSFPWINSYVSYSDFSPINYYSYKNTITIGKPKELNHRIKFWREDFDEKLIKTPPLKIAKEILNNEFK